MGCGGSKDDNPDEIKSEMKTVKIAEFDDFFSTASEVLSGLEDLRATFQETREEMHEYGRTSELVEPKLIEAFKIFFWSVSAHKEGNILAAGIKWTSDPASFTVDCSYMDWTTWYFADALQRMVGGVLKAPQQIIDVAAKIKEVGEKATELGKDFQGKVKGAGLNPLDTAKAIGYVGANLKTIADGVKKAPNVLEQAKAGLKDIVEIIPKIADLMGSADEVGKEAFKKGHLRMGEIFDHHQKEKKKTPEQIKAEEKAAKKAKKGKGKKHKKGDKKGGKAKAGHEAKKDAHPEAKKEAHHA